MNNLEYDGQYYHSDTIPVMYKRYIILGDEMTLLCHSKKVSESKRPILNISNLKILPLKKRNSFKELIFGASKTENIVKEEVFKADICVVHLPSYHGSIVVKYAKKYSKPYMTVICACPWDGLWNFNWKGKLMAPESYLRLRMAQRNAPFSIYVTKYFLQQRYPTSGKSINCSNVNIKTGNSAVLNRRLEKISKWKNEKRPLCIGTAAAIDVPYKGQQYVIRAIGQLRNMGIRMEYHIVGPGNKDRLQKIINSMNLNEQIFIHGVLPHDNMADYYDNIDIYVQPSKQEGLPRSLIEAMSRGCLCLGSNIAGIPELLTKQFLFQKGDIEGIVRILNSITSDTMREEAIKNFELAKEYDQDILNERRKNFLMEFKSSLIE